MNRFPRMALGLLALGWAFWLGMVICKTPPSDPGHFPIASQFETALSLNVRGFPRSGIIGYRDEFHPDTPEFEDRRNKTVLLTQYPAAPVILDPAGGHELTLVFGKDKFRLERSRSKP